MLWPDEIAFTANQQVGKVNFCGKIINEALFMIAMIGDWSVWNPSIESITLPIHSINPQRISDLLNE